MRRPLWSCSLGKKHSLIIARIYPNLAQSSGLLEAQEQEPNLYKDWKIFRSSNRSAFLIVGIGHYLPTLDLFRVESNPSNALHIKIHLNLEIVSPIHPLWDFDPEVVSFGAGGIIWCLIKTGSMSSPPHINIVFKSRLLRLSHGSNLTHDTYTLHRSEIKSLKSLTNCLLFSNVSTTVNVSVSKVRIIGKIRMYTSKLQIKKIWHSLYD